MVILFYNLIMLVLVVSSILSVGLNFKKIKRPVTVLFLLGIIIGIISFFMVIFFPIDIWGKMQLSAWTLFLYCPIYLLGSSIIIFKRNKSFSRFCIVCSAGFFLVGYYSFFVETHWLQITHRTISSKKIKEPVRVALIADIQTDCPGKYEQRILRAVKDKNPDIVLLAGDYIQVFDTSQYHYEAGKLNTIIKQANLDPPLGIYAVKGNVERSKIWTGIFEDTSVKTVSETSVFDCGDFVLTALSERDSFNVGTVVPKQEKFHVVLGHCPNFALGDINADLLLAGHTHGGQIRLPLVGPLLPVCRVPRAWAAGITKISDDKTLIVSRGVGLERGYAPRIRFLSRPELVFIDLVPDDQ